MRLSLTPRLACAFVGVALMPAQTVPSVQAFSKWTALNPSYIVAVAGDANGNVYVASSDLTGTISEKSYVAKVGPDGSIIYQTQLKYTGSLAPGDSGSVWVLGVGKLDAQGNLTPLSVNGGVIASVEYAGVAPGLVAAQQINVLIPADSQTGPAVPVRIGVLDAQSPSFVWAWTQDGVTLAVQ